MSDAGEQRQARIVWASDGEFAGSVAPGWQVQWQIRTERGEPHTLTVGRGEWKGAWLEIDGRRTPMGRPRGDVTPPEQVVRLDQSCSVKIVLSSPTAPSQGYNVDLRFDGRPESVGRPEWSTSMPALVRRLRWMRGDLADTVHDHPDGGPAMGLRVMAEYLLDAVLLVIWTVRMAISPLRSSRGERYRLPH